MEAGNLKNYGWTLIAVSFVLSMIVVSSAPDIDEVEECRNTTTGPTYEPCQEVLADDETSMAWFTFVCCFPTLIGGSMILKGYKSTTNASDSVNYTTNQVAQSTHSPAYMAPAQPTYSPPAPFVQPSSPNEDLLRKQRMKSVDLLVQQGRFMEAALEAENAGDYKMAGELRTAAEDLLRKDHKPQSNNEERYLAYLTSALADGFLSVVEEQFLEKQRAELGINWETHAKMLDTAGYSHDHLKLLQNAKSMEDSGRFKVSAALYEAAGNLERAQMLRMKANAIQSNSTNITYNITDSAIGGNVGDGGDVQ